MAIDMSNNAWKWQWESGLPDDFHGVVQESWFDYSDPLDDGTVNVNLYLNVMTDDVEIGEAGLYNMRVKVGSDEKWEVIEQGQMVRSRKGETRRYHRQSHIATFIDSAIEAGLDLAANGSGDPFRADLWQGVEGDWQRKTFTSPNRDGTTREWEWLVFSDGAGDGDSGEGSGSNGATAEAAKPAAAVAAVAKKAVAKKAAPAIKAAAPIVEAQTQEAAEGVAGVPADTDALAGLGAVVKAKLKAAAAKHTEHGAWVEEVFQYAEVLADANLQVALVESSDGSIWATIKAG